MVNGMKTTIPGTAAQTIIRTITVTVARSPVIVGTHVSVAEIQTVAAGAVENLGKTNEMPAVQVIINPTKNGKVKIREEDYQVVFATAALVAAVEVDVLAGKFKAFTIRFRFEHLVLHLRGIGEKCHSKTSDVVLNIQNQHVVYV